MLEPLPRDALGLYLHPLLNIRRCILHAGYVASELSILTKLTRMCRSAIPLAWGIWHASLYFCVVMVLPNASSHCETLKVNRCQIRQVRSILECQTIRGCTMRSTFQLVLYGDDQGASS